MRLRSLYLLFTCLVAFAFSCKKSKNEMAEQPKPEAVAEESAVSYKVDVKSTTLRWTGSKDAGTHTGTIQLKSGTISTEKQIITAGEFTVNMKTIVDEDLKDPKENKKLVDDLSSDNFFHVEKFPTSQFKITKATKLEKPDPSGNNYSIEGNLTIKDVTKNITIPAQVDILAKEVKVASQFSISRKEFKLKYAKGKLFRGIGDSIIHDTIKFNLELIATS